MDLMVWEVHENHAFVYWDSVTPESEYDWNVEDTTPVAALPAPLSATLSMV